MKFRTAYSKSERVYLVYVKDEEPLTEQSHQDECDINNILSRYQKTGVLEHTSEHQQNYGFASSQDFRESMEIIAKANSMFADLPSSLRTKFKNNPEIYLDFIQNPNNLDEMYKLGLATKPPKVQKPQSIPVHIENPDDLSKSTKHVKSNKTEVEKPK